VAASAPGCHISRDGKLGQPFKIFIGSDDDWTPPKPCLAFIEDQKNNGVTFSDIEIIKGVGHSYSTRDTRWNDQAISFRGCSNSRVTSLGNGKFKQKDELFDYQEYKKRCHTIGATSGGPGDKVDELARKPNIIPIIASAIVLNIEILSILSSVFKFISILYK
jgi:hypothetical protein